MLRNITLNGLFFKAIMAMAAVIALLAGCEDELLYRPTGITDGVVEVNGEVFFRPLVPSQVKARGKEAPEGAKYTGINSLFLYFFNKDQSFNETLTGKIANATAATPDGSSDYRVEFEKNVEAGQYYIFAVANITDVQNAAIIDSIKNPDLPGTPIEKLRNFRVEWNDDIDRDIEMFGVFKLTPAGETPTAPDNADFESEQLIALDRPTNTIHSWVRRATSKVTVDFDGSNLKDGVKVFIKSAVLKDVADATKLGAPSAAAKDSGIKRVGADKQSTYELSYGSGDDPTRWLTVTKGGNSAVDLSAEELNNLHSDNAKSLPCYENLQGTPEGKSKKQDRDGDGIIDSEFKDGVDDGTYLEVVGYYKANRPEYISEGEIIYRFMLGQDAVSNFDLIRNHHYQITMCFNDYGNDVDWHISYAEKYLDVTYPRDVDYQGRFFKPDPDYNQDPLSDPNATPNGGQSFDNLNTITVTSYKTADGVNEWIEPEIICNYYLYNPETGKFDIPDSSPDGWLTISDGGISADNKQKEYTFVASMDQPVDPTFPSNLTTTKNAPYNLSNPDGKSSVENTANCYMVGAGGWYSLPLVYGNAITGGATYDKAYNSPSMKNHLNNKISRPYIVDNPGVKLTAANTDVKVLWQDAQGLINPSDVYFIPELFGDKGGIVFYVNAVSEGNALIALIDNSADEDQYVYLNRGEVYGTGGSTRAVWSWHIWVTHIGFGELEKDVTILNHYEKPYDIMPVNLGWCPYGKSVQYYRRRKCEITFKIGDKEIVRTIEQYPHYLVPRGDNTYYQWGRKDPFVGSNAIFCNKPRWNSNGDTYGEEPKYNPPRLYNDPAIFSNNINRKPTKDCLEALVKNPDKWLNAPRWPDSVIVNEKGDTLQILSFHSLNQSPTDLWCIDGAKTVYDPCPPGYKVGNDSVFCGFSVTGGSAKYSYHWYDMLERDMPAEYYKGQPINSQVLPFYTDPRKIQVVNFPITGYRDYDGKAEVVSYYNFNSNTNTTSNGIGYLWLNTATSDKLSNYFKYYREDLTVDLKNLTDAQVKAELNKRTGFIGFESFFNTDGMAIRPVKIK